MKTTNKLKLVVIGILATSSSFAQTAKPVELSTQVEETQQYVDSILSQFDGNTDRFQLSQDYAVAGAELAKTQNEYILNFKKSISAISKGPLSLAIKEYNDLVSDQSLSEAIRNDRKNAKLQVLKTLASATELSYEAAIKKLYEIEPSWKMARYEQLQRDAFFLRGFDHTQSTKVYFQDGTELRAKDNSDKDYRSAEQIFTPEIRDRMIRTLYNACKINGKPTQTCINSLRSDYLLYFSEVQNGLDKDITTQLRDGNTITLRALKTVNNIAGNTVTILSTFQFDDTFTNLPLSN